MNWVSTGESRTPMFELNGKVALITGAASGIGAGTARLFAKAGARLALAYYSPDGHDIGALRADINALGADAIVADVDMRSTAAVEDFVAATIGRYGRLDIVVANAAIARDAASETLTDEAWDDLIDVDLTGVWRCFRAALPHMMKQHSGRLLATASTAGIVEAWPRHVHYSAAKAAISGLVRSLAVEVGAYGITVNAVAPGLIETPQSLDPVNSLGPDLVRSQAARIPVRRIGQPEDIANAFLFFANESSSYISGQVLVVDGARTLAYDWAL